MADDAPAIDPRTGQPQTGNVNGRDFAIAYGRTRPTIYGRTYAIIMGRTYDVIYGRPYPGSL